MDGWMDLSLNALNSVGGITDMKIGIFTNC